MSWSQWKHTLPPLPPTACTARHNTLQHCPLSLPLAHSLTSDLSPPGMPTGGDKGVSSTGPSERGVGGFGGWSGRNRLSLRCMYWVGEAFRWLCPGPGRSCQRPCSCLMLFSCSKLLLSSPPSLAYTRLFLAFWGIKFLLIFIFCAAARYFFYLIFPLAFAEI